MNILSVQSSVAYGHVGNSAAVFPLQRLGFSVWPVNTLHFSNHTGYGDWRGPVLPAEDVAEVIRGVEDRDAVLPDCDAVLSGYVGDPSLGRVVLDAVARAKAANPRAIYCCDPVMGDTGRRFFVRPGIPGSMRSEAVPAADVVMPNRFELEFLADRTITNLNDALAAADAVRALGPGLVLVTSLVRRDAPAGGIEMLAASAEGAWIVRTPLLPLLVNGAGDMPSALFLAHLLRGVGTEGALSKTASSVYAVLEETYRAYAREISSISAQDTIADPPDRFPTRCVR